MIPRSKQILPLKLQAQQQLQLLHLPATSGLIQIPINNDTDEEEDETFTLTLTGISGAVFANDQSSIVVQVTIIDDEGLADIIN